MKTGPKYRVVFAKGGELRFISHLDLMALYRRAVRRAGLPFVLTKGFTPRVRLSMPEALKLGVESPALELTLWLSEKWEEEKIEEALNRQLPEGVKVKSVHYTGSDDRVV